MKQSIGSWTKGIKGRLLFVAVFPFIAFGIIFFFTFSGLNKISALVESAHNDILPNVSILDDMLLSQNRFGYRVWEGISNADERAEVTKEAQASLNLFKQAFEEYQKTSFDPEEEQLFSSVKESFPLYISTAEKIIAGLTTNTPDSVESSKTLLDQDLHHISAKLEAFIEKATSNYDKRAARESAQFDHDRKQIINLMIAVTLCAGLAILALQMLTGAKISKSVGGIAERLQSSGSRVVESVQQMSEAGNGLSQNATQAAASLEETVAALEEMSSMVQMNSDNAKQAAALAVSSRDAAEKGEAEIKSLIMSMAEISGSSKKIEEIITVIDDIAFQTNLLALNAAVEAARAGEQGRGFAVVAEAVRALAQRSASSAKDISTLIKNSVGQVERGSKIADQSGEVLGTIVTSIKKVSDLNNEIAAASSEQTTGIQQISKAMNQLDQTSQSNAASAEEIAATSAEINSLANISQDLTVELNREVLGLADVTAEEAKREPKMELKKAPLHKASAAKASAGLSKTAKVLPMTKKSQLAAQKAAAEETIPFDDEPRAKVGTTEGF